MERIFERFQERASDSAPWAAPGWAWRLPQHRGAARGRIGESSWGKGAASVYAAGAASDEGGRAIHIAVPEHHLKWLFLKKRPL